MDFTEKIQVYEHFRGEFLLYACSLAALEDFERTAQLVREMPLFKDDKSTLSLLTERNRLLAYKTLTVNNLYDFMVFPQETFWGEIEEGLQDEAEHRFSQIVSVVNEDNENGSSGRLFKRFRNSMAHANYYLSGNQHDSILEFLDYSPNGKNRIHCKIRLADLNHYSQWFINSIVFPAMRAIDAELRERGMINEG